MAGVIAGLIAWACILLPLKAPAQTVSNGATDQTHKTSNGREFSKLSEADVDGLSDSEYDKYQKWKIARKQAELAQADERLGQSKARLAQAEERGKQLDAELVKAYFQMIGNFEALKAGGQTSYPVFQEIRSKLKEVLANRKPLEVVQEIDRRGLRQAVLESPQNK